MPRIEGRSGKTKEQIRLDIFDTYILEAGKKLDGVIKFFSNVQGKSRSLTNLKMNSTFENQVEFLVQGIGFDAISHDVADIALLPSLIDTTALSLVIGEKEYWRGPLRYVAGRLNHYNPEIVEFGSHAPSFIALKGHDSIKIPSLQTFELSWQVDVASAVATSEKRFVASLKGIQRRPIQ